MVAKRLILRVSKKFPAFVRCPVSRFKRVVTKKINHNSMTPVLFSIVKSFREVCIIDCNVKSFHNSPY